MSLHDELLADIEVFCNAASPSCILQGVEDSLTTAPAVDVVLAALLRFSELKNDSELNSFVRGLAVLVE